MTSTTVNNNPIEEGYGKATRSPPALLARLKEGGRGGARLFVSRNRGHGHFRHKLPRPRGSSASQNRAMDHPAARDACGASDSDWNGINCVEPHGAARWWRRPPTLHPRPFLRRCRCCSKHERTSPSWRGPELLRPRFANIVWRSPNPLGPE